MCNRYGYLAPVSRLVDAFSEVNIPLRFEGGALPNLEPREHIRPTNTAPIIRPLDPAMHRFSKVGSEIFCFPGLWDVAHTADGRIESFTIVTTAPGPDCAPYHNRQPVILERDQWATWLDLTADPAPCLRAGLEGVIAVERAVEGTTEALIALS